MSSIPTLYTPIYNPSSIFDDQLPRIIEINNQPTGLQPWKPGEWK